MPVPQRSAVFLSGFREDLREWVSIDRKMALRVIDLVEAVLRDPFGGIGKPEPLRYGKVNAWSRRVDQEHRLVYVVYDDRIDFAQCRRHY